MFVLICVKASTVEMAVVVKEETVLVMKVITILKMFALTCVTESTVESAAVA